MYFIMILLAAIVSTIFRFRLPQNKYKLNNLCFIYWGAALMWFVDHVIAFFIEGGEFFEITLDATFLGIIVVLGGLFLWAIISFLKTFRKPI
ncbi:hypothetical protein [Anaerotignum sp.]|uniref:hypothetical protein n=1 Tax=Anaerotignum sp. TaxID=2039241 RepID=UPI003327904F